MIVGYPVYHTVVNLPSARASRFTYVKDIRRRVLPTREELCLVIDNLVECMDMIRSQAFRLLDR